MIVYRIRNWSKNFENNKSRQVDACRYVCMPNKQDGVGLTRILSEPDGTIIFGVWCLILQACSRQRERDGWLTDDGTENGRPWDLEDLALRWRRPIVEIERALVITSSSKVAWIEALQSKCPLPGTKCPPGALKEGKEWKEGKGTPSAPDGTPDPTDISTPSIPQKLDTSEPEKVADHLRAFIDWRANDPAQERANVAELAQLVGRFGLAPVNHAGEVVAKREGRKARIWQLLPAILGPKSPEAGTTNSLEAPARLLIAAHGWKACTDAAGLSHTTIASAEDILAAMVTTASVFDAVDAALGAKVSA